MGLIDNKMEEGVRRPGVESLGEAVKSRKFLRMKWNEDP